MTCEECNKIIAEYMGYDTTNKCTCSDCYTFSGSLDALVPVWIKLAKTKGDGVWINFARHGAEDYHMAFFRHYDTDYDYADCVDVTPQSVAAIATAKAIQELNK